MSSKKRTVDGRVTRFDAAVGLGEITVDERSYAFHAIALADGTRRIGVGAEVRAALRPGHGGVWEAIDVELLVESFPCRVCGAAVEGQADSYLVCPICGWEDDPVQSDDPSYSGGANVASLDQARAAWLSKD